MEDVKTKLLDNFPRFPMNQKLRSKSLLSLLVLFGIFSILCISTFHLSYRPSTTSFSQLSRPVGDSGNGTTTSSTSVCAGFDLASEREKINTLPEIPLSKKDLRRYVCAIMDHNHGLTSGLECPVKIGARYNYLQNSSSGLFGSKKIKYFFALDLHKAIKVIVPLMGSIIEAMRFLGPEHCALSIVEGRSDDGTAEILSALRKELAAMGVPYYLSRSILDPTAPGDNRITDLAKLRNQALEPLLRKDHWISPYDRDVKIFFVNDVVLCPEDLLELIHQHIMQSAVMSCAFDWNAGGGSFYDSWVARSMSGNLLFEVTHNNKWIETDNLFFDDLENRDRYNKYLPMQVYACWNGMATIDGAPFIDGRVTFRSSDKDECYMGEPTLLAKDFWKLGIGNILSVPSINVAYDNEATRIAKEKHGYVHEKVDTSTAEPTDQELIQWTSEPPGMVKCMPEWGRQWWVKPI